MAMNRNSYEAMKKFFQKSGARVLSNPIHGFDHIFPNDLPPHPEFNRYSSCGIIGENDFGATNPKVGGLSKNCGYDTARYVLGHLKSKNEWSWSTKSKLG